MRPFLTIVTRTCRRPKMLTDCIQSVLDQTCHDLEQIFIVDRSGYHPEGNILWANRQFAANDHRIAGRYVFMLDDDGVLADPTFVEKAMALAQIVDWHQAILVRSTSLDRNGRQVAMPPQVLWDLDWDGGERPNQWRGHGYNIVTRADTWIRHAAAYGNARNGGDWHFMISLMDSGVRFVKLDGTVRSARSTQRGHGNKFEQCTPDWFERIAGRFGITDLGGGDWRLRLWEK